MNLDSSERSKELGMRISKFMDEHVFPVESIYAEQMEEFGKCIRNNLEPEVGGEWASRSLAVIRAGVKSARERRYVSIEEIMETGE